MNGDVNRKREVGMEAAGAAMARTRAMDMDSGARRHSRACACPSAAAEARPAVEGMAVWGKGRDRCV